MNSCIEDKYCLVCGSPLVKCGLNMYVCSDCNSDYTIDETDENTIIVLIDKDAERGVENEDKRCNKEFF